MRRLLTDPVFVNNPASVPGAAPRDRFTIMKKLNIPTDLVDYLADKIFEIDGPDHRRLRKLASCAFTARRVARLRPRIEEITSTLLDRMTRAGRDGSPVDLMEAFAYPLPITVICELIGIDEADRPQWHDWGSVLSTPMAHVERLPTVFRDSIGQLLDIIARRRAAPRDDLISAFIQAQEDDGDRLSDREMVPLVFTMVIAGHETTTYLLGNSVLALLENQDQLALLREDPSRWPQAVNELMRLGPAQFGQPRYPVEDVELGGVSIPKGDPIIPLLLSANTDPRKYEDPRRLDVTRDTGHAHVGFGQGAHYCLGAPLALLEGERGAQRAVHPVPGRVPRRGPRRAPVDAAPRLHPGRAHPAEPRLSRPPSRAPAPSVLRPPHRSLETHVTEQKYTLRTVTLDNLNLEAVYEGYREDTPDALPTPWDIGRAQSALVELEEADQIKGEVIDVGCGLGDNAIFLASRGYRTTGVDGSANAIDECRKRAAAQGLDVDFAVADAASLDGFENRFDTVVDSALYHCLNEENQRNYVAALHRATRPGAKLHLFCFSKELPRPSPSSSGSASRTCARPSASCGTSPRSSRPPTTPPSRPRSSAS
ncbi:cytochrome P450 [Streptomyces albogriseolus]|uniref:cytochrome P450 n=1 Tax=Streptomyces albogriseolus TaxID=1887 RepID=UPI0034616592